MLRIFYNITFTCFLIVFIFFIFPGHIHARETDTFNNSIKTQIPVEGSTVIPFRTDEYRYQNMGLLPRAFTSLVSSSLGFIEWDRYDWLTAGGVIASTTALMVPYNGLSPDTRLYYWARGNKVKELKHVFFNVNTEAWAGIIASWTVLFYGTGWILNNKTILEYISLTLEAIGLTQFYHVAFKLMLGREGPVHGNGRGIIYGPARSLKFFPYGTPSGHIATMYAMATVAAEYYDSWILRVLSHLVGVYYAVNIIYNGGHFISDIVWGASLGYFVGRWVVKHRSSRYRYTQKKNRSGIAIKEAVIDKSPGDILVFPFYNAETKSVHICVNYVF